MAYKLVCWPNSIRIPVTNKEEECLFYKDSNQISNQNGLNNIQTIT